MAHFSKYYSLIAFSPSLNFVSYHMFLFEYIITMVTLNNDEFKFKGVNILHYLELKIHKNCKLWERFMFCLPFLHL